MGSFLFKNKTLANTIRLSSESTHDIEITITLYYLCLQQPWALKCKGQVTN